MTVKEAPRRAAHRAKAVAATPPMVRIGKSEPITSIHGKTNIDSSLIATIAIYCAQSSILFLVPITSIYLASWVVLFVKTHV
jgi:hypothetical protein